MTDATKRTLRTFLQSGVGAFALLAIPWLNRVLEWASGDVAEFPDVTVLGRAAVAFVVAVAISAVSWVQNRLEDSGRIQPRLKESVGARTLRRTTPEPVPQPSDPYE